MYSIFDVNGQILMIVAVAVSLIAVLGIGISLKLYAKMKKFEKAYTSLQTFLSGIRMEDLLKANLTEVRELSREVSSQGARLQKAEEKLRNGIDKAGLVRFNSFENMGAELSFALALLNQEGTGVILTGIHSIEESRVYCKSVEKGQASVKLNKEEKEAIEKASATVKI